MDFTQLITFCQEYIDKLDEMGYDCDDDSGHYIYEVAMMAIFGTGVWKWVNEKMG